MAEVKFRDPAEYARSLRAVAVEAGTKAQEFDAAARITFSLAQNPRQAEDAFMLSDQASEAMKVYRQQREQAGQPVPAIETAAQKMRGLQSFLEEQATTLEGLPSHEEIDQTEGAAPKVLDMLHNQVEQSISTADALVAERVGKVKDLVAIADGTVMPAGVTEATPAEGEAAAEPKATGQAVVSPLGGIVDVGATILGANPKYAALAPILGSVGHSMLDNPETLAGLLGGKGGQGGQGGAAAFQQVTGLASSLFATLGKKKA